MGKTLSLIGLGFIVLGIILLLKSFNPDDASSSSWLVGGIGLSFIVFIGLPCIGIHMSEINKRREKEAHDNLDK